MATPRWPHGSISADHAGLSRTVPAPQTGSRPSPRTGAGPSGRRHERGGTVAETTYNGYCVKCKEKRDFQGEVAVSKTGMNMAKGKCPVCGTTMNRILGKAKAS